MTDDLGFVHAHVEPTDAGTDVTVLALHGTGGDERDLVPLAQALFPGARIVSPRGKVVENGMPRFFRRFAEGVFDVEDLKVRAEELADFVDAAAAAYGFDASRVVACGYSNGANIAAGMMLLRPEVLSGGVLFKTMMPFEPETVPDVTGRRVFISAGGRDPMIPPDSTRQLEGLLRAGGAEVVVNWTEGGHELRPEEVQAAREWVAAQGFVGATASAEGEGGA